MVADCLASRERAHANGFARLESATSLGRERYFQGNGLVDLMRAIQSV